MKIQIPELTHLQYAILLTLADGKTLSGEEIRLRIRQFGANFNAEPKFYQLMSRMEKSDLLVGEYTDRKTNPRQVRERKYKQTDKGTKAVNISFEFYHYIPPMF